MINSIFSILSICACVVGAGYLSGDELIDNLGSDNMAVMAIITSILYSAAVYAILEWSKKNNVYTLDIALNKLPCKSKLIIKLSLIFATTTLCCNMIMLAGNCINDIAGYNGVLPLGQYAVVILLVIGNINANNKFTKPINNIALIAIILLLLFSTHKSVQINIHQIDLNRIAQYAIVNITLTLPIIISNKHEKSHPLHVSIGVAIMLIIISLITIFNYGSYETFSNNNTNSILLTKTVAITISAYCTCLCCLSSMSSISKKDKTITAMILCISSISVTLEDTIITYILSNTAMLTGYISIISIIIHCLLALHE